MGVKVDSLIFQVSAEADRGEQEKALAADDLLPIMVFANGPEHAYLVGARRPDVDAAFDEAAKLAEGLGAERLALRMRVFESMAYAIETDMKYLAEGDFPNDATFLFVEALYQYGVDEAAQVEACAARFTRENLQDPDFEMAPPAGEQRPDGTLDA